MSPRQRSRLPDWVPNDHPAHEILARYDGKTRGSIQFGLIDPNDVHEEIATWENLLGTRLIGVGLEDHGHAQFYVASDGRCFGSSEVHDAFYFHADSLKKFQLGQMLRRRSRPMLRPDQASVDLYGIEFFPGDPEIYLPSDSSRTNGEQAGSSNGGQRPS